MKMAAIQWLYDSFEVAILTVLLLIAAIGQRLGFKVAGYGLGDTPYLMIFLSVLGSVPLNTLLYGYMLKRTGGVLPEYRTWRYYWDYWIIATLSVGNGIAMMYANPHVSGYVQALISNVAIPMTMALSMCFLQARFSIAALSGVFCILLGLMFIAGSPDGASSSAAWTGIFVAAQLPLSAACVYQEFAFRESLNMVHYIHFVTLFLLFDIVLLLPVDMIFGESKDLPTLVAHSVHAAQCIANVGPANCDGVGAGLLAYILSMNAGNLFQALLIKKVDATWYMVVLSLSTPLAAISFSFPMLVGDTHAETLNSGAIIATALIGVGTVIYRLGSLSQSKSEDDDSSPDGYQPLADEASSPKPFKHVAVQTDITVGTHMLDAKRLLQLFMKLERDSRPKPAVVAAGVGLFASEYTNATRNPMSIFDERTFLERSKRSKSVSPERGLSHGFNDDSPDVSRHMSKQVSR